MNTSLIRMISRLLVVCLLALPFTAKAGMIGTSVVTAEMQAGAARATINSFVSRADLSRQMQALGLDPATAKDRVAALTDVEASQLADRINSLPAGADGTALVLIILIGVIIWWAVK